MKDDHVALAIEDDGIGTARERADNAQTHGLLGMRERAAYLDGTAEISCRANGGTSVRIRLPAGGAGGITSLPPDSRTSDSAAAQRAGEAATTGSAPSV